MDFSRIASGSLPISIVIPTYRRESILIATIKLLLDLKMKPAEILVLDQTERHQEAVESALQDLASIGSIRLIRLAEPSIPHAMNRGLCEATQNLVLFVDDDIVPEPALLEMHLSTCEKTNAALIAGRVIQPWQEGKDFPKDGTFHFATTREGWISEFIGCNFMVRRDVALRLGGFDEQFVSVAYNFEAEFAFRLRQAGYRIFYEPTACVYHLRDSGGGTRSYGNHLTTCRPNHAVGAYYFILRTWSGWQSLGRFLARPLRAIATRHHLRQPWWIPATLVAELSGMAWAMVLAIQGPRYLNLMQLRNGGGSSD